MKKKGICYGLILLFVTFSVWAEAKKAWMQSSYIVESFIDIALNNEYASHKSGIRKWKQPIRYYFIHRVADESLHEYLSNLHLSHLKNITGHDIQETKQAKEANLYIIFSKERFLEQELKNDFKIKSKTERKQLVKNSVCLAHFYVNQDSSLQKAVVIIPVDRARAKAKLVSCIVEELTQIMGLPNDSDKVFPSIFNDKSSNELLSGLDYILLKILYHPDLKIGLREKNVRGIVNNIIQQFNQQGIVSQAENKVMAGELYPLLYN